MRAKLLAVAMAGLFGGALHASSIVSCSWSTTALNSCVTGGLTNFQTKLDWATFTTADGSLHTGLWSGTLGGVNISLSESGATGDSMRAAYNFGSLKVGSQWYDLTSAPIASPYYNFAGHFNTATNVNQTDPLPPDDLTYGDHLMSLVGTSTLNASKSLAIDFGATKLSNIGFRLAGATSSTFNATIQLFNGTSLIGTQSFTGLTGGGTCAGVTLNLQPPVPCNDAKFISAVGFDQQITKILISTNDANGFYIGDIFETAVPEPTPMIFAGCGLILLILGKKKWGGA